MQIKYKKQFLVYCATTLLFGSSLFAAQPEELNKEVGLKELSSETLLELNSVEEEQEMEVEEQENSLSEIPLEKTTHLFGLPNLFGPWPTYHQIDNLHDEYGCVKLNDSSRWKIAAKDERKVSRWKPYQPIAIVVHQSWNDAQKSETKYFYQLVNTSTNSKAWANLFLGSNIHNPFYRFVIGLNLAGRQVMLNDGSTWIVAKEDLPLLKAWKTEETIIIGNYNGWFTSYKNILINVDYNHYIRAKKL
jgi:hypothetical protein